MLTKLTTPMCGRFASYKRNRYHVLEAALQQQFPAGESRERFNICPTDPVPIVRPARDGRYEMVDATWGLIPYWAEKPKVQFSTINARAETIASNKTFREAFTRRRCLIPADGFYEWQAWPGRATKQPWFIEMADALPFAFAGLWERWKGDGTVIDSCTIITTAANDMMARIHNRMPVILTPADYAMWMRDGGTELLRPYPSERMRAVEISTHVNKPENEGAQCIKPRNSL